MSVLIPKMKMPMACYDCNFAIDGLCVAMMPPQTRNWKEKETTNYCPLVKGPEEDSKTDVMQKIEELKEVMRNGQNNANQIMLASESQASAAHYQQRAIELVEEITGEEWNFTYLSYW